MLIGQMIHLLLLRDNNNCKNLGYYKNNSKKNSLKKRLNRTKKEYSEKIG